MDLLHKDESYAIMGAAFEVYKQLGCGFLEAVYQEALGREFRVRGIHAEPQRRLFIRYKDEPLEQYYEADFVCYGKIILELKSVRVIEDSHRAQLHNYLRATDHALGILLNFGHHPKLEYERIANTIRK